MFARALTILPEAKVPLQFRAEVRAQQAEVKCATPLFAEIRRQFSDFTREQQSVLKSLFMRPTFPEPASYVGPSGRFRIHYTTVGDSSVSTIDLDGNSVPDFVEEVAAAFDSSFRAEINVLGYLEPPSDLGVDGQEYDVYIVALESFVYGYTQLENPVPGTARDDYTSFIVIDNDFNNGHYSTGIAGAQVTAAHEFLHAIQFGYRDASIRNEYFYYELCASWMEDVVYDEVNDYYASVPGYLNRTHDSFNQYISGPFIYGEAIWNHFLTERLGTPDAIRRSWEIMQNNTPVLDALDAALKESGQTFGNMFAEFAAWNYFTGERADIDNYYSEGESFPEVRLRVDGNLLADTTVVDSSHSLAYAYYRFAILDDTDYLLNWLVDRPSNWRFSLIILKPGETPELRIVANSSGASLDDLPAGTEVAIIPVNLSVLDGRDMSLFSRTYERFQFTFARGVPDLREQGISDIYPNPFVIEQHSEINFRYKPVGTINLNVRILDSNGRVVRHASLAAGDAGLTLSNFAWDGHDDDNQPVASGIYLIQVRQDSFIQFGKFAVIRN